MVVCRLGLGDVAYEGAGVGFASRAPASGAPSGESEGVADAPVSATDAAGLAVHRENPIRQSEGVSTNDVYPIPAPVRGRSCDSSRRHTSLTEWDTGVGS